MEALAMVSAEVRILQMHLALLEESESDSVAIVHAGSNQEVS